jgi:hypothetical protein
MCITVKSFNLIRILKSMLMLAPANHPFMNNLMREMGGESCGRLPEGQNLRAVYSGANRPCKDYDALQQQSSAEDQVEINQVQSFLSETTPPPVVDESQCDHDLDSIGPEQLLWNVDTDVASDGFPPATPSVHTSSSGENIVGGSVDELSAVAHTRPQRLRGRPAGVKNKPKTNVEAAPRARRQVQKRARESQLWSSDSDGDTLDTMTPIVVRVVKDPPPLKKTRRTKATAAKITTVKEDREHVERQKQRAVIMLNFATDLQSFSNYLDIKGGVSGLYNSFNINSKVN